MRMAQKKIKMKLLCCQTSVYKFVQCNNNRKLSIKLSISHSIETDVEKTLRGVNPYEKSCDFYKIFCVQSYSTKKAKWIKVSTLSFLFPTNILSNKVKKVCYKIIFIHGQFIM